MKENIGGSNNDYVLIDTYKKVDLEGQLMWQLRNKNKLFSKTEIQLSSTIGQGNTLFSTHSTLLSLSLSMILRQTGEFGLVYKGYVDDKHGTGLVAIKTSKGIIQV